MKNKIKLKKFLNLTILISLIFIISNIFITILEYKTYTINFNNKINSIASTIREEYPNISEDELIEVINSKDSSENIFKKYNFDLKKDNLVSKNKNTLYKFLIINTILFVSLILILILNFLKYNSKKDNEIDEITKYIEEINKKNYSLNIEEISEDELSILKNEIYKTTITLKEQAENSQRDKIELKDSLSNISHQLKTPLTSILIILDNLIENPEMDKETRQDFIFDIKREINNINFLVQNLLKISKLDTNTVTFDNKDVSVETIINESIKKLSMLCDLKNIKIKLNSKTDVILKVDKNWQIEAISNILKNCIEHSKENSKIDIEVEKNKIYSEIVIKDYGIGIASEDLPHIFERFYKGKNSSKDSIGIGLALSKKIIEQSNGKITIESKVNEGTTFIIKYYKN